jgi:hypothetical protein
VNKADIKRLVKSIRAKWQPWPNKDEDLVYCTRGRPCLTPEVQKILDKAIKEQDLGTYSVGNSTLKIKAIRVINYPTECIWGWHTGGTSYSYKIDNGEWEEIRHWVELERAIQKLVGLPVDVPKEGNPFGNKATEEIFSILHKAENLDRLMTAMAYAVKMDDRHKGWHDVQDDLAPAQNEIFCEIKAIFRGIPLPENTKLIKLAWKFYRKNRNSWQNWLSRKPIPGHEYLVQKQDPPTYCEFEVIDLTANGAQVFRNNDYDVCNRWIEGKPLKKVC